MNLFGLNLSPITLNIILPVGISFYTFQTLAYVVDIYKGKKEAEHHFGYFALFVSYFPQLVAGPIENSSVLLPQLKKEKKFTSDNFFKGIRFLTTGYIKKILIADLIGIYVAEVYGNILGYSGVSLLIATILFGFQIYGDFAGYSEIAIGCSSLLGIDLTTNFDRPYLSSSLKEFWNRWHITLNNFFTEYIYIPLGGSKKGKVRQCLNIFIVFLISGIWHGASIHFVLWGIAHGILMIIENLLRPQLDKLWNDRFKLIRRILDTAIVFTLVSLVWVLFRANTINDALTIYGRILSFSSGQEIFFGGTTKVLMIIISFIILVCSYYLPTININLLQNDDRNIMNIVIYTSLIVVLVAVFAYELSTQGESSFIYFQF